MKANRAIMPKLFCSMFTGLLLNRANCAKTILARRKPLIVPECHIIIGYGTGTAAWILTQVHRMITTFCHPLYQQALLRLKRTD